MPMYCFTCTKCGETTEMVLEIAQRKRRGLCRCGGIAERDIAAEQRGTKRVKEYSAISTALAVDPEDIEKTMAEDKAMGSMASEYLPDGRLKFTSLRQHREYARLRGYHDRDGFV